MASSLRVLWRSRAVAVPSRAYPSLNPATLISRNLLCATSSTKQSWNNRAFRSKSAKGTVPSDYFDNHHGRSWKPASEPGIDTNSSDPANGPYKRCGITAVDFSEDKIELTELHNDTLEDFLKTPRPEWASTRWINVNGLSWDVVRMLGNHKKLHTLAIEDLLHTKSRTKVDWYTDHAFIVLTLQKLIPLHVSRDGPRSPEHARKRDAILSHLSKFPSMRRTMQHNKGDMAAIAAGHDVSNFDQPDETSLQHDDMRTLHTYRGDSSAERIAYMKKRSMLTRYGLTVAVEQVSMFLCSDGTVISFFEHSADDIEDPILERLRTPGTILRRTTDASMIIYAIIDGIADMAMPIMAAYGDAIAELEMDVLNHPTIEHSQALYILTSELALLRSQVQPITLLVKALRDHSPRSSLSSEVVPAVGSKRTDSAHDGARPDTKVIVTPTAYTYLADVEDHCVTITATLDQMSASASSMISLIFNTIGSYQNETFKQLTEVSIFFLPLTFITGYMGMNFDKFAAVQNHSDAFFWALAIPFTTIMAIFLKRDRIRRTFGHSWLRRLYFGRSKKNPRQ